MSGTYTYTAKVWALNGAVVPMIAYGRTAGCALTNLKRDRCGDWTRIEVGTGEGEAFRVLREVER